MFRLRIMDALTEQIATDAVELSHPVFFARSTAMAACISRTPQSELAKRQPSPNAT
jgi:hypothetical protein